MIKLLALIAFTVATAHAQFLTYDANRRVAWFDNATFSRDEYDWWAENTGQPSQLFSNTIFISQETGTNDVRLAAARQLKATAAGVSIGVVDQNNDHGRRVSNIVNRVCGVAPQLWGSIRLDGDDIAAGISNFVNTGKRIIIVPAGSGNHLGASNACRLAERSNVLVFCSLPNTPSSIDTNPDYPSFWAASNKAIIPVAMTGRDGELVAGATAWGTNSFAAPGRNIIAHIPNNNTNYSSGNSYSAPILGEMVALLVSINTNQVIPAYREAMLKATTPIVNSRRVDALSLLLAPQATLTIVGTTITMHGLSQWRYAIEHTYDFQNWTHFTNVFGTQSFAAKPGFYRANASYGTTNAFVENPDFAQEVSWQPGLSPEQKESLPEVFGGLR